MSGTFLTGVGDVAAIVGTIAVVWVTLRVSSSKRRLLISMPVVTPLLNDQPGMPDDVEVLRAGGRLTFPQIVYIELAGRGRNDIPKAAFDGEPLCLDIGVPIVKPPSVVVTSPGNRRAPPCWHDGSKLLIGPCNIGKRQTTVFSLLVDGYCPKLSDPLQSLIDVDLRADLRARVTGSEPPLKRQGIVATGVIILAAFLAAHPIVHNSPLYAACGLGLLLVGVVLGIVSGVRGGWLLGDD